MQVAGRPFPPAGECRAGRKHVIEMDTNQLDGDK